MDTRCARCDAAMSCDPAGDCWCKELPHGPMPAGNILEPQSRQAGAQHSLEARDKAAPLQEARVTGCLCRDCLQRDLRALGLLPPELD